MLEISWLAALCAFAVTLTLLKTLLNTGVFARVIDLPNQRSLHTQPTPRIGGIALTFGSIGTYLILVEQPLWYILVPMFLLIGISFADDVFGLKARWRFVVHFAAGIVFVIWGLEGISIFVLLILAPLAIVWMMNLYNFMDGSDGLAGGMTVIGFSVYGVVALRGNESDIGVLCICISAAGGAFLTHNFYPAKVFLGDAGSVPLGFAASAIGFVGWTRNIWPNWFPLLVFSPFIADATSTLLKRMYFEDSFWEPHRNHYYQRLVQLGWGHRRTAFLEYTVMAVAGMSAFVALRWNSWQVLLMLSGWLIFYSIVGVVIDRAWSQHQAKSELR
jgi:UDP-GlcNAc:undecaprenyl-phosphate/decaprenyl-phosphate GlcNAc-1-phosphate transferase